MRIRPVSRLFLFVVASVFALGLQAYLLVQSMLHKTPSSTNFAKADECEDPAAMTSQENPNKLLFISCGGFEE